MIKLNLGCGHHYLDGWVNVDFYDDSKCDIKHDLEVFPWPWEDNSVSEILIKHTLEHLGADWRVYIKILQEMYRVCEDDATITVCVPSPWHWNYTSDPSHVRPITPDGLNLFSKEHCQKCIDDGTPETPFAMIYDIDLRPGKNVSWVLDQYWQRKIDKGEIHRSQIEELHNLYRNVVAEFEILLAVVKSEETDKKHRYDHTLHLPGGEIPSKTEPPSNIARS